MTTTTVDAARHALERAATMASWLTVIADIPTRVPAMYVAEPRASSTSSLILQSTHVIARTARHAMRHMATATATVQQPLLISYFVEPVHSSSMSW